MLDHYLSCRSSLRSSGRSHRPLWSGAAVISGCYRRIQLRRFLIKLCLRGELAAMRDRSNFAQSCAEKMKWRQSTDWLISFLLFLAFFIKSSSSGKEWYILNALRHRCISIDVVLLDSLHWNSVSLCVNRKKTNRWKFAIVYRLLGFKNTF